MKKSFFIFLCLFLPLLGYAQFGEARWIGTNDVVLYSSYLPQFKVSYTVRVDRKSQSGKVGVLFGGNDPRLMNGSMNILGVENGKDASYIKMEVDASGVPAHLNVYRVGYTTAGVELMKSFEIPADIVNEENRYEPHTIGADCCLGNTDFFIDGKKIGSVGLNPLGNGGDFIAFPQLANIGYEMEAGQEAVISNIKVQNYRSPYATLFEDNAIRKIGNKKKADRHLFDPSNGAMPVFSCSFSLKDKPVESATLIASARGIYFATLNGSPVSNEYFAPGISQYNKTHYYQSYDVSSLLNTAGNRQNDLRAELGEGWWSGGMTYSGGNWNFFGDQLSFIARLTVHYADGDSTVIATNPTTWKVSTDGKVRYASLFQGEVQDLAARKQQWKPAKEITLEGHLPSEGGGTMPKVNDYSEFRLLPATTSVLPFDTITAKSVTSPKKGIFIYDMGQNMAGVPLVQLPKMDGEVTFRYAEVLYPDLPEYADKAGTMMLENIRAAMAQDKCTVSTKTENRVFSPRATLHGYRYIEITGIDEPLPLEDVKSIVLSSVHQFTADFECSNPLVNRLWENTKWSMLSNFISMPTDCPQRNERMGWSGDISVFSRTATYMADVDEFLRKHIQAMRDVQLPDGRFPDIAPVGGGFGGLLWGSAGITVPWECWMHYGDKALLAEHYPAMRAYIDYIESHYIDPTTGILVQERQWGDLGDWLGLEDGKNDKSLLFEAYYIYDLTLMHKTALLLGMTDDAARYENRLNERKQFFIDTYINIETGQTIASAYDPRRKGQLIDIQGSYVLPLAFGIVDGELKQKMLDNLVKTIERENTTDDGTLCPPYSLMTGFITTAWISLALSDNGRSDIAYRLLQQETYPSWLYPITQGATTIWERLNSYTHTRGFGGNNSMNSFNHYSFGAVCQWLISRSLGIERDEAHPGFRHFILRPTPDPTGQMTFARGHLDTRFGRIESAWEIGDGKVHYEFTIPQGTSATLILPDAEPQEIGEGHHNATTVCATSR
ncbi:MAG: family 78 glycoside hydrolase catalytic domain [Prevotellaceae bacterium]|nr:family 78 glycoside hydrolase catalytic domain [Prevotellaceae bacterium]